MSKFGIDFPRLLGRAFICIATTLLSSADGFWGRFMHHCINKRIKRITFSTLRETPKLLLLLLSNASQKYIYVVQYSESRLISKCKHFFYIWESFCSTANDLQGATNTTMLQNHIHTGFHKSYTSGGPTNLLSKNHQN